MERVRLSARSSSSAKGFRPSKTGWLSDRLLYPTRSFSTTRVRRSAAAASQKLIFKYRSQAGITKRIGCHALRHTFASIKAQRGVSAFQLQEWLGHANLNTTQIYVHLAKKGAKKAMQETSL